MRENAYRHPLSYCRFGIARCDVTPPVGIYARNWGAALHDTAKGVHRPFTASAMVFASLSGDGEQMVVVAVDHGWMLPHVDAPLRQRILAQCGLDASQLMFTLSHTHAGPNTNCPAPDVPGAQLIQPYLDTLAQSCIQAIQEARRCMLPAIITYGVGHCDLATNRDCFDETAQQPVCGFNPEREADTTLLVARVTGEADHCVALMVNYACHPTTLAWENTLLSPDYVGAMREVLETLYGVPVVFLQGACGELNPRDAYQGDPEYADRNGRRLGYAAASVIEGLLPGGVEMYYAGMVPSGANLGIWAYRQLASAALVNASVVRGKMVEIDLPVKPHPSLSESHEAVIQARKKLDALSFCFDEAQVRQARLELELAHRALWRWQSIPDDGTHKLQAWVFRIGEAIFVGVQAELYSQFQRILRERFPRNCVFVLSLTNGWLAYLCPREVYGQHVYQETVCPYQIGALEQVTESTGAAVEEMLAQ